MRIFFILTFALGMLSCSQADESTSAQLSSVSDNLTIGEKWRGEVLPFLKTQGNVSFLNLKNGLRLRYAQFSVSDDAQTVLIVPGYSEFIEKYAEFIYDLNQAGYNVVILDHIGMGLSSRLVKNKLMIHIDRFSTYTSSIKELITALNLKDILLYAHSMGALVASHVVAENPTYFSRVAYSSPLFGLNLGGRSRTFTRAMIGSLVLFRGSSYAPGFSDCTEKDFPFENNTATSSEIRWEYGRIYERKKEFWMCAPSTRWVQEILKATSSSVLKGIAKKHALPTKIFSPSQDSFMAPEKVHDFAGWTSYADLRVFADAKHELYREREGVRNILLDELLKFYR